MLSNHHITIVKSTLPLLENAGTVLTAHFYQRMFANNPELKDIFNLTNQATGRQQVALFEAIAAYAKHIEDLAQLSNAVERIAQKHTSFNIQADHYQIVGHHLIETLRELAPEAFTSQVEEAWTAAYGFLAGIFIDREAELYQERRVANGGWEGSRAFNVVAKTPESELVTSFVFEPVDGQAVLSYQSGQYLGVEVKPQSSEHKEIRQYSISQAVNDSNYRISVKRELGGVTPNDVPKGLVSNYLHDHIEVGDVVHLYPPAGDFFFVDRNSPVVLLSAGVGITPMQSMLETLVSIDYKNSVTFYHACESRYQHSFDKRNKKICEEHGWDYKVWYQAGDSDEHHITRGFMNFEAQELPIDEGHFYLCGPVGFMQFAKRELMKKGVNESRIHYEVFGPHASL